MKVEAVLCDHAEIADGKLFINGGAIGLMWVQPQPPYIVNFAVAIVARVPHTETNQPHHVVVALEDADGHGVVPWKPDGAPSPPPVQLETTFNIGRPATLTPGDEQALPLAFTMPALPLAALGGYSVRIDIDGETASRLPFRVLGH